MDFDLTAEQRERTERIRAGAGTCVSDSARPPGRGAWGAAGRLGITGLCLPIDHGGRSLGPLDTALGLEAFCDGGASTGFAFGIGAHLLACGLVIARYGGPETRAELLGGMCAGTTIAANAMSEDEAGSDVSRLATTAVADGDAYVLDGVKSWVSNAPLADVLVVYAVTAPTAGYLGISAFAVPRDLPGVHVGPPLAKLGLDGCDAARVTLQGARVPRCHLLGSENQGSAVFQDSMTWERACLPAIYLGAMEAQLRRCVDHARERRQFGRRIADFQAVSHRLATMRQRLEGSRLLLYRACWALDRAEARGVESAALAKTAVAEAAVANGLDAVSVFGARGYLEDGVGRDVVDAVPSHIFSGTTDIQREIVARGMGV